MGDIVDLQEAKAKKLPHATGACVCLACQHDWIAVIPLPLPTGGFIECPSCGQKKGTMSPLIFVVIWVRNNTANLNQGRGVILNEEQACEETQR